MLNSVLVQMCCFLPLMDKELTNGSSMEIRWQKPTGKKIMDIDTEEMIDELAEAQSGGD